MKLVITGGTGLIGRHLIPRLLDLGHQITVATRNPQKASSVPGPRVTLWQGLAAVPYTPLRTPGTEADPVSRLMLSKQTKKKKKKK
ncbi:NAD(P)H-binding protein, partial [Escherichia coli]|uniref:NAD(P)H-binding protein n=1 Tax=Escherichia coli TaxID=562 RepID=UPI00207B38C4